MRIFSRNISPAWLAEAAALHGPTYLNLWQVSGRREWGRLNKGDVLLLTRPDDPRRIVGFGTVSVCTADYLSRTWNRFGRKNGADCLLAMRHAVETQRPLASHDDPVVLNTTLINPVLLPTAHPYVLSTRFSNLARTVGLTNEEADRLLADIHVHVALHSSFGELPQERYVSDLDLEEPLMPLAEAGCWSAYHRRCAVTGWKADVTLRVVLIRPFAHGGTADISNTMLLRSELADLYNALLIAFAENHQLVMHLDLARLDPKAYGALGRFTLKPPREHRHAPNLDSVIWRLNGPFVSRSF